MRKKVLPYCVSGGTAFVFDFAFLYLLTAYTDLHYVIAVLLGFLLGTVVSYSINHFWVFKESQRTVTKGYVYFLQIALIGVLLTVGFVALMIEFFHLNTFAARAIAAGLVFTWSFPANYFLNFKAHK